MDAKGLFLYTEVLVIIGNALANYLNWKKVTTRRLMTMEEKEATSMKTYRDHRKILGPVALTRRLSKSAKGF